MSVLLELLMFTFNCTKSVKKNLFFKFDFYISKLVYVHLEQKY